MVQESIELRNELKCPKLSSINPIDSIKRRIKYEESLRPKNYTTIRID